MNVVSEVMDRKAACELGISEAVFLSLGGTLLGLYIASAPGPSHNPFEYFG